MTAAAVAFLSSSSALLPLFVLWVAPVVVSATAENIERSGIFDQPPVLDKPLLGIQIGGIVGAYVISIAVLLAFLLLVGRRLRRTAQSSNYTLQMEMLKPAKPSVSVDPSPASPTAQNLHSPSKASGFTTSWGSLGKGAIPSAQSVNDSIATIDESVVASDRKRAQDEMEKLYAAVMEHDAQREAGADASVKEPDSQIQSPASQYTNPFTDRASRVSNGSSMAPLKSPKSSNGSRLSRIFSSNSRSSVDSNKLRSPRAPIRTLPISPPLGSPDMNASRSYGQDQEPISPRIYSPRPPPVAPRSPPTAGPAMLPPGRARPPAPLSLAPAVGQPPASLPFREIYPPQSAPATKTTILERPVNHRTGPVTGMPTPYSPYMPFTPVTPFTPGRTVTKRQRKREERENGLRVLSEDDMVKDDTDMWG